MTWQRIDDDTYIDDSLVTCAEYQLFIDEMREQGKYYQPDHWKSYQFPAGQARAPILGVRQLDAIDFCAWLTNHEADQIRFRLPMDKETNTSSMKFETALLGYWLHDPDLGVMIRFDPNDRFPDMTNNPSPDLVQDFDLHRNKVNRESGFMWIGDEPENSRKVYFDRDNLSYKTVLHDKNITAALDRAFLRRRNRPLDITFTHFVALSIDRSIQLGLVLTRDLNLADNRVHSLQYWAKRSLVYSDDPQFDIDHDVFVDIFTLQERIAGRSPAFEGIRLVKERIK